MSQSLRVRGSQALRASQRQTGRPRYQRRFAHDEHHSSSVEHNESFGKSFYIVVTAIPSLYLVWALSRPNSDNSPNAWTKALEKYSDYRQTWIDRNSLHTRMVEQAAHDRNLFINTPGPAYHELRYPEVFSAGSQINVPAGHGSANLDHLVAHYREEAAKDEERKLQNLKAKQKAADSAQS